MYQTQYSSNAYHYSFRKKDVRIKILHDFLA